jgi:type IV pilus assembly protein PilO
MATTSKTTRIDLGQSFGRFSRQFRNLDARDPSRWPAVPRALLCLLLIAVVLGACWYVWLSDYDDQAKAEEAKEVVLRQEFTTKLTKAVNLDALKAQRAQVQQYVTQLEKQLPSKAEMAALLSDVNQAGLGRNLQFDLFRPGDVQVRDYYAELPIAVRVTGRYHDIGTFAADIAHLSRIVTLSNLSITPAKDGGLVMDVTARTFRYLDPDEVAAQRKAAADKKKQGR